MLPVNRMDSWSTILICARSEFQSEVADITPINENLSFIRVVQARNELGNGAFPSTRMSDYGYHLARLDHKGKSI